MEKILEILQQMNELKFKEFEDFCIVCYNLGWNDADDGVYQEDSIFNRLVEFYKNAVDEEGFNHERAV